MLKRWPVKHRIRAVVHKVVGNVSKISCRSRLGTSAKNLRGSPGVTAWLFQVQLQPLDMQQKASFRRSDSISTQGKLVIYTGRLTATQNIAHLVETRSLPNALHDTVEVAIAGANRNAAERLRSDIDPSFESKLHIIHRVPRKRWLDITASADISITFRIRSRNPPLKLFDCFGTGISVVAFDAETHRVMLAIGAKFREPEAINGVCAIKMLLNDDERYEENKNKYVKMPKQMMSKETSETMADDAYSQLCVSRPKSSPVVWQ